MGFSNNTMSGFFDINKGCYQNLSIICKGDYNDSDILNSIA
jgi:hypothetical protein